MKFSELDLHPTVRKGIEDNKFLECTDIQERSIPLILEAKDLAGLAQTGTGKTAAFLIPLMDRMLWSNEENCPEEYKKRCFKEWRKSNFILVLVPTRELAEQVYTNFMSLRSDSGLKAVAVYGGTSYEPQKKAFEENVDIVIATPGRLIDLFKEHIVDLSQVRAIVFDEADRMFDMGFKDDMKYVLQRIPKDRQFLVYSATLNFEVLEVAYENGAHPIEVNVSRDQAKAVNVEDHILHVSSSEKPQILLSLLKKYDPKQTIIFSNFRNNVERVAKFLSANGYPAMGISSLLTQPQRLRVMEQFRQENDKNILIATDVAARGLDVKGVDLVVNFELPDDAENYVHRIGRTGRASAKGQAYSLVSDKDVEALQRIESFLENKLEVLWLEDDEILKEFNAMPEERRRSFKDSRGGGKSRDSRSKDGRKGRGGDSRDSKSRDSRKSSGGEYKAKDSSRKTGGKNKPRKNRAQDSAETKSFKSDQKPTQSRGPKKNKNFKPGKRKGYRSKNKSYTHKPGQQQPSQGLGGKIAGFFKKLLD